jgi:hypothetical protein
MSIGIPIYAHLRRDLVPQQHRNVIPPNRQKSQLLSKKPGFAMVLSVGLPCQGKMEN